jgi:hypothetical protein
MVENQSNKDSLTKALSSDSGDHAISAKSRWECYGEIAATVWNSQVRDPIAERASRSDNLMLARIGMVKGYNPLDDIYS